ncbi:MAG: protein-L-isoaspartate O-methyltransferase [Planctomycetes bacterium]|nr:protein-L-isoaspartate O-methyltransferase [Planctomycetota bacterium]
MLLTAACAGQPAGDGTSPATLRAKMVDEQLKARDISDKRVLEALGKVPRHEFVPKEWRASAYQDRPLPIGQGQTISQPYIVALMTQLAAPKAGQRVLEVGTGSGYQAAVLAELAAEVYTIELLGELAEEAKTRLKRLGYRLEPAPDSAPQADKERRGRIRVKTGDGYLGWPDAAPFDAIVVTCGAEHVPEPLFEQLKPGGRMVIPVGKTLADQVLKVITKGPKGERQERDVTAVRFVPLRRAGKGKD